jgi:hypothetical protein
MCFRGHSSTTLYTVVIFADALTHVSSTIGTTHSRTLSNIGIPLASSVSDGFVIGLEDRITYGRPVLQSLTPDAYQFP